MRHTALSLIVLILCCIARSTSAQTFYASVVIDVPIESKTLRLDVSNCTTPEIYTCPPNNTNQIFELQYTDIAIDMNQNVYYVSGWGSLYRRKLNDVASCQYLGTFGVTINAMVADINGVIWAAGNNNGSCGLYKYDPQNNSFNKVGDFPPAVFSSGDLLFYEGRLFLMATNSGLSNSYIIEVNTNNPLASCFHMDLQNLHPFGAFSINDPTRDKAYIISLVNISPNNYISSLIEIDLITQTIGPVICDYPYAITGAASIYNYVTPPIPQVSIAASDIDICFGEPVTFTMTVINGNGSQAYQWQKNGNIVGTNTATYTDNTLDNNDRITCTLISGNGCSPYAMVVSNQIVMKVTPVLNPAVSITATSNTICPGNTITFVAAITNGGANPVYQWKKNGNIVGTNASTYIDNTLNNNDGITCTVNFASACVIPASAVSNTIIMQVSTAITPSVNVIATDNPICLNNMAIFTATVINGGSAPAYQWKKNGINVGTNSTMYTDRTISNGDIISCTVIADANCQATSSATSNSITVNVLQNPIVSLTPAPTACFEDTRQLDAGSFVSYLWKDGSTGRTMQVNAEGTYYVTVTDANGCKGSDTTEINMCSSSFYIPTAFSPNQDGLNDLFKPSLFGNVKTYRFEIYSRYGQLLFRTTDTSKGWDGNLQGKNQGSNVFVWMCSYQFEGQTEVIRKGNVVLIR